jgi:hypothetical protein
MVEAMKEEIGLVTYPLQRAGLTLGIEKMASITHTPKASVYSTRYSSIS